MKTTDELRAILDALPRPIDLCSVVQIVSHEAEKAQVMLRMDRPTDPWYTAQSPEEALFMLQYMAERKTR